MTAAHWHVHVALRAPKTVSTGLVVGCFGDIAAAGEYVADVAASSDIPADLDGLVIQRQPGPWLDCLLGAPEDPS